MSLNYNFSCPCLNGGQCRQTSAHVECQCPKGYTGHFCERQCTTVDSELGDPNCNALCPCRNAGTCTGIGGACECRNGFFGNLCEKTCPEGVLTFWFRVVFWIIDVNIELN